MDLEPNDEYYNDLLKFWRKHKIYMGKEMMSTIAEAKGKITVLSIEINDIKLYRSLKVYPYFEFVSISAKKKAKQRGRRKSHEFEDLDLNKKTGKLTPAIEEADEDNSGEEDSVKSSPEGTPKLKKKSVTEQPQVNGKLTHIEHAHKRESSAKSTSKFVSKTAHSNGKIATKTSIQRKISDQGKSKK